MKEKSIFKTWISILLVLSLVVSGISIPVNGKAAETYMVFFDSQGGSFCNYITDIPENSTITLPTPTKEGYVFDGWYTDSEYTDRFWSYEKVTDSMLLYAKWKKKSIRTAKAEYVGDPVVINNYVKKEDIIVTVTYADGTTAILDDEEFYLQNDLIANVGENNFVSIYYSDTNYERYLCSVKVKGVKESVYCIGFDTMGGSVIAPITGIAPGTYVQLPADPTKEGYKFDGWYMEKTYETKFTAETAINKTFIVYAKWVKESEQTEGEETESKEMTLNMSVVNLKINATDSIFVNTVDPYLEVYYVSSNDKVVSVDENGIITGLKDGRATIWVYTEYDDVFKCKVGVGTKQYITAIKTKKDSKKVVKGDTYQIKTTIVPKTMSKSLISYSSSNTYIATVNASGLVKAKKKGTCYITIKANDGSGLKKKVKIIVV